MSPKNDGQQYWKSLEALAGSPSIQRALEEEFPGYNPNEIVGMSRRRFVQLASASMALAGVALTGCRRWPQEHVVDQNSRAPGHTPGVPEKYATAMELGGVAQPLLVTTYDGRPIKIEGNPLHPLTKTFNGKLGASSLMAQASILEMYDPERSRNIVMRAGEKVQNVAMPGFVSEIQKHFASLKNDGGKVGILVEATSSPSVWAMLDAFKAKYPGVTVATYEAISRDNEIAASVAVFGGPSRDVLKLANAKTIVSFDADLFGTHPNAIRHSADWAKNRRSVDDSHSMNRMYVIESTYSLTGSVADERRPSTVANIEKLVLAVAAALGLRDGQAGLSADDQKTVELIAADLKKGKGEAVVAGGSHLRPEILAVIAHINDAIGAYGQTVHRIRDDNHGNSHKALTDLSAAVKSGNINTLLILGGNPAYTAPADTGFKDAIAALSANADAFSLHLSLYNDETSKNTKWHVNRAHYLETWGDAVAWDGTVGVAQPTIQPLFGGLSIIELLAIVLGETTASITGLKPEEAAQLSLGQAIVYRTWSKLMNKPSVGSDNDFRKILHDGFSGTVTAPLANGTVNKINVSFDAATSGYEIRLLPDLKMHDGRFANNGWLQECPDPVTKIAWDNAAYISYADAVKLNVLQDFGDHTCGIIRITTPDGKNLEVPAFILPGQPEGVISIPLGWGRKHAGIIGSNTGYDAYGLRNANNLHTIFNAKVERTGDTATVATTQAHHLIERLGEEIRTERIGKKYEPGLIVHESSLGAFTKNAGAPHGKSEKLLPLQLFPGPNERAPKRTGGPGQFNDPHAWGMAIDMNSCMGCQACVVACQAENNIPIVGKEQVVRNREMHWLRIDRYFKGPQDDPNPEITYQPMMCVHCENAPCEQVCPVAATVHDSEGLNTMVYNRCIGTRYCSNNCPYKVRRFNYLDYQSRANDPSQAKLPWLGIPDTQQKESIDKIKAMVFNPDVTLRMRGVMEKCTYCVQRVKAASIDRRNEWINGKRPEPTVDDLDVVTACQQACPTEAIVFGNLNDEHSLVSRLQENKRSYAVLAELNNRPRTQHLAKIRNPAVEVAVAETKEAEKH